MKIQLPLKGRQQKGLMPIGKENRLVPTCRQVGLERRSIFLTQVHFYSVFLLSLS